VRIRVKHITIQCVQGAAVQGVLDNPPDYKYVMLIDPDVKEEQVLEGQDGDRIVLTCYENENPVDGQITISLRQPRKPYTLAPIYSNFLRNR
jgi:hypothetical protein